MPEAVVGEGVIKLAAGNADMGEGTGSVEGAFPKADAELSPKADCNGAVGANADWGCMLCAVTAAGKAAWPNTDPVAGAAAAKPEGCPENGENPPPPRKVPKGLGPVVVEPKAPEPGLISDDCPKAGADCAWSKVEVVWGDCPKADLGAWPKVEVG